jgi:tRNA pseudouridine55 synthase
MDGIINLHKPAGITSAKALYRVRAVTGQRKSGHAGTLDPAASGVLLLCLGRATKLVERIMDQPKLYRAGAHLDVTSESFDSDRPMRPVVGCERPDASHIVEALRGFEGEIQQVPPAISAVKVAGQPAYKRKAADAPLNLRPRPVQVYWIHLHRYDWPRIDFEMCCGRGTYVRALIRDLAAQLGTGGCLTSLVRTRVGPFAIENAVLLDDIAPGRNQSHQGAERTEVASQSGRGTSSIGAVHNPEYLVPFDDGLRLLSPEDVVIPPRP